MIEEIQREVQEEKLLIDLRKKGNTRVAEGLLVSYSYVDIKNEGEG